MQKFLLTFAAAAFAAGTMMAEDVTLSVSAATDIDGTLVEATTTANAHYQPLNSLKIGDFSFTFQGGAGVQDTQLPSLYHTNATPTIRVYLGSQMTISFPASAEVGSITWTLSSIKGIDNNITCSTGEVEANNGEKTVVWNNSAKATEVTFTLPSVKGSDKNNPNVQITGFVVSAEGTVIEPDPVDPTPSSNYVYEGLVSSSDWTFENIELPEGLTYVWKWDESYKNLKASAFVKQAYATESWAISPVIDLTSVVDPKLTFEHAEGYFTGLNLAEILSLNIREEGGEWVELPLKGWSSKNWEWISENLSLSSYMGKKVQFGAKYTSTAENAVTWEIKNFRVAGKTSGVAELTSANGEAVYYDLNGRRVAEPANGLFIKVQDNKATKVIIK